MQSICAQIWSSLHCCHVTLDLTVGWLKVQFTETSLQQTVTARLEHPHAFLYTNFNLQNTNLQQHKFDMNSTKIFMKSFTNILNF